MKRDYANYHVGLKVLLKRGNKILFLTDAAMQKLDLPGGRIDNVEHEVPLPKIIAREVREELGKTIRYKLGLPLFQYRRHVASRNLHVFITVYDAIFLSGMIKLSFEHSDYQWVDPKKLKLTSKDFFHKEEYLAFKKYFESLS